MTNWKKKQEYKKILDGLKISTGLKVYQEIAIELDRLWEIESKAKEVLSPFPTEGSNFYPSTKLESRIQDRITKTKTLIGLLK